MPLPDDDDSICGACCLNKPDVDRVITAYRFEEPLRTLLHAFKYREGLYLTSLLTNLMLHAAIDTSNLQCLIPIPLHPKRLQERGFNQAAILAMRLSRILKVPYNLTQCKKIINTIPQAGLSASLRKTNLKNAFQAPSLPYQHVTLIDDILTTGNTANELARTLKQQGVKQVDVWCCARVTPKIRVR
ncbi:MAG: ComF family protein [Legionellaceae bacterium]|nr:ComF family protein [Legionellaceae bacterium]